MTISSYSSKVVKTRKLHTCEYCGNKIPVGSSALRESGIDEEGPFSTYACESCQPLMDEFQKWINANFYEDDIFLIQDAFDEFKQEKGISDV